MSKKSARARVELAISTGPQTAGFERKILPSRLSAAFLVLSFGLTLFLIRDLAFVLFADRPSFHSYSSGVLALNFLVAVAFGSAAYWLRSAQSPSLAWLRFLEYSGFSVIGLLVGLNQFEALLLQVDRGQPGLAVGVVRGFMFIYFLLMVIYGLLIPNDWRSAARVVIPLGLAPLLVNLIAYLADPEFAALCAEAVTLEETTVSAVLQILAMTTVIYGAHVVYSLRREVLEAKRFGQYQLTSKIGSGGMGEVWEAEHSMLARPAAIKLIRPEALGGTQEADSAVLQRFEREAQAMARLQSPHTVHVHDFGMTDEGILYYVMELLVGLDLDSLVTRFGPLSPERAAFLVLHACESLGEAHLNGLIHRDVKPANIFTCRLAQQYDFVKVLDFGLVRKRTAPEDTRLTVSGTVAGTPAFIAPEAAMDASRADERSDIYSLGCVFYFLVTGEPVFGGKTPMETIMQHVRDAPVAPSRRSELEIPEALDRIILDCLAKEESERPESVFELSQRIEATGLAAEWDQGQAEKWWEKHLPETV